jgi:hypothetical protein
VPRDCRICNEPIADNRLKAKPNALTCVTCASQQETHVTRCISGCIGNDDVPLRQSDPEDWFSLKVENPIYQGDFDGDFDRDTELHS